MRRAHGQWMEWVRRANAEIPALWLALKDKDTPLRAKVLAALTIGYACSPMDLIPDFIPVLGYLDDIILLPLLIAWTVRWMDQEVLARSRQQAQGREGPPKKWRYAIPIGILWAVLLACLLHAVKKMPWWSEEFCGILS